MNSIAGSNRITLTAELDEPQVNKDYRTQTALA